jgi:hypothetical protein
MTKTTKKLKNSAAKPVAVSPAPAKTAPASTPKVLPSPTAASVAPLNPAPAKAAAPKPTVNPVNRVSLELVKPGAKQVCVAGSFNGWKPDQTPLVPVGNDHWVGDLAVKPGRHEYLFVVDGQWLQDPNAKEAVQNPFGGKNSVLIVSA